MAVEELKEIMSQRFDAQDKMIDQRFKALDQRFEAIDQRFEALDQRFEALENRQDRLEARMDRIEAKLDRVLELVAIQHGERASTARFWKHAAWLTPTLIALAAFIKSFFL